MFPLRRRRPKGHVVQWLEDFRSFEEPLIETQLRLKFVVVVVVSTAGLGR